jgi:hypothetical protein
MLTFLKEWVLYEKHIVYRGKAFFIQTLMHYSNLDTLFNTRNNNRKTKTSQ